MPIGMRIGSTGFGPNAGANMRMGAVRVPVQKPTETPKPEKKVVKKAPKVETIAEVVEAEEKDNKWGPLSNLTIGKLEKAGYETITQFKGLSEAQLLNIPGVGPAVAAKILEFNA